MRIVFIGTGEIGVPVLRWLLEANEHELAGVVTQPDRPVGRDQRIQPPPIKAALGDSAIPVFQPERIKHADAVENIRALQPEVVVVMAYGQILPHSILEIPNIACLNLHASLLPKYRGAAPIQAAIVAGERETGITVMYMDEGLDTGDILLQTRLPIRADETGQTLHDQLGEIAPGALADALAKLQPGPAPRFPQNSSEATYAPKLERAHGRIDWTEPASLIERQIRAFDPWPGAFAVLRDPAGRERNLKIYHASVVPQEVTAPGAITLREESLAISARDAALHLENVQLEGKRRMRSAELLRGNPWIVSATTIPAG